ncbi:hypothetical protein GCM10020254_81390 [Streptomyces goshikiensis]
MADITRRFGWRHLRSAPTAHIRHHKRGRLVHDGPGLSFWYRSLSAALSEVPVDDRELAMAFHARTSDFQDVSVQASVTYRISDPAEAAARLDFSVDPDTGSWRGAPWSRSPLSSPRPRSSTRWTYWPGPRWPSPWLTASHPCGGASPPVSPPSPGSRPPA